MTNSILNEGWQKEISKTNVESAGIIDGGEIVFDFLENNEWGCAFEHLTYIISEIDLDLNPEQNDRMDRIAKKLNIK